MPSASNAKSEKPASSEAMDNSPIRQIMTIIEHKIRNLEKRKSKLTSYRDLQKAGKELNSDQKVAVAKYDEVAQTLEFARELSKQISSIATSAEREAKKQAKKEAWIRYTADTNKIREVLLILDCLMQMGSNEAREDFLNGTNGACKLTEVDLKILDDLYPEVTPKHEVNEEGQPGFAGYTMKAAEHLYAIVDGKPKEVLGTTYSHIKEIVTAVHDCGYFDKIPETEAEAAPVESNHVAEAEEAPVETEGAAEGIAYPTALPVPPAPGVVPAPAYPLRAMPPLTLQEIEHAYFAQQYPQPRPIADVIGSQNFYFLQESEIDSPAGTPQPAPPEPGAIPTQTFTNQHFVGITADGAPLPLPHFAPRPDRAGYPVPIPAPMPAVLPAPLPPPPQQTAPPEPPQPTPAPAPEPAAPVAATPAPAAHADDKPEDEWQEADRTAGGGQSAGQGDARYRRYGRGGRGAQQNGYRRGGYSRPAGDFHRPATRQYDGYRKDTHYNGDADVTEREHGAAGARGRGRGGARPSRPPPRHYARRPDRAERVDRPE